MGLALTLSVALASLLTPQRLLLRMVYRSTQPSLYAYTVLNLDVGVKVEGQLAPCDGSIPFISFPMRALSDFGRCSPLSAISGLEGAFADETIHVKGRSIPSLIKGSML